MQEKPNFTIKDATVTKSGKYIRLYGAYEADGEGKVFSDSILVEAGKFALLKKTEVVENGKARMKVEGLIGATLRDPVLRPVPVTDDKKTSATPGDEETQEGKTKFLIYLHEAKVIYKSGKEFGYQESPPTPREDEQRHQAQHAAPGM